jgi:hypothetical protein
MAFNARMDAKFKIIDMGDLSHLLGVHITRDGTVRTISIDKSKYVKDILVKHNMYDSKPSSLPMEPGFLSGLSHMDFPFLTGRANDVYPSMVRICTRGAYCFRTSQVLVVDLRQISGVTAIN